MVPFKVLYLRKYRYMIDLSDSFEVGPCGMNLFKDFMDRVKLWIGF